ncbi:MAG: exonuclease domain-containing protein [Anaerolineaceae bacterium]|nr:exonuclease domain-containing protein [Anaerolineaceae bacterium]
MENRLDQILVIDLETTCWRGDPPAGQQSEIIEIGLCRLDVDSLQRLETRSIIVRPVESEVSEFCTELTTLTPADVARGISLREACRILRDEYAAEERLWASFGDYDRKKFERECRSKAVAYPFGDAHLNVKNLFAVVHRLPQEVELDKVLAMLGWEMEGTYHRGDSDAWNIARVLAHILERARS